MSSYLVYICQAVKNRAGLERYWREVPSVRQHRTRRAKYLVVLAEGGVPPVEQRMPRTRIA
jgi:hypothetical protein